MGWVVHIQVLGKGRETGQNVCLVLIMARWVWSIGTVITAAVTDVRNDIDTGLEWLK